MHTEMIGWIAAGLLLVTISTQVWQQWRSRSVAGVSPWLFIGQISASTAFVIYSYLLENLVFVLTNSMLLVAALLGQLLYLRNKRQSGQAQQKAEVGTANTVAVRASGRR